MPPNVTIRQQRRGPVLKLMLMVMAKDDDLSNFKTEPYDADALAMIRFALWNAGNELHVQVSVKKNETTESVININVNCDKTETWEKVCLPDWSGYCLLGRIEPDSFTYCDKCTSGVRQKICLYSLEATITAKDVTHSLKIPVEQLGFNEDLVLCTPEGSVALHKEVLAKHSGFFETLLKNGSMEATNQVPVHGFTLQTVNQLKDYLYLGTLPVTNLPQLLLLAREGKMDELKSACITKLATVVGASELDSLIDFAIQHKIPELMHAMLSLTSARVIHGAHRLRRNDDQFRTINLTHD